MILRIILNLSHLDDTTLRIGGRTYVLPFTPTRADIGRYVYITPNGVRAESEPDWHTRQRRLLKSTIETIRGEK